LSKAKKIKVEYYGEDKPFGHPLAKAICRLIKYLGDKTIITSDGCEDNTEDFDITLTIVIQDDKSRLDSCRNLLNNPEENKIRKKRFLFLHIDDRYDKRYHFWEKILNNLGLGKAIDVNIFLEKRLDANISSSIIKVIEELYSDIDSSFACSIFKKLKYLQDEFKEDFKKIYKNLAKEIKDVPINIDEIEMPDDLRHNFTKEVASASETKKSEKEDEEFYNILKTNSLFYSYLREALVDWSGQNKWVLRKADFDCDFNFLILDDKMWKSNWPDEEREHNFQKDLVRCKAISNYISDRKWNFYRLIDDGEKNTFKVRVKDILKYSNKFQFKCSLIENPIESNQCFNKKLIDFTHILIDWRLEEGEQYSGLNLVRELKTWGNKNSKELRLIPELLVLTRNPDPVTIQSALEAGASGYVIKDNIAELPLIVGRTGKPLTVDEKKEIDSLSIDNFPSLKSFPAFVPKVLYFNEWKKNKDLEPNVGSINDEEFDSESIINEHREWLNKIPKADLHVHIGVAIPIDVCYDLAIISVYRWLHQYNYEKDTEEYKGINKDKYKQMIDAAKLIGDIIINTANKKGESNEFRNCYLEAFKETTKIYEVVTVNNTIKRLNRRFDKLSEEQIACLLVTGIGFLCNENIYNERSLCKRIIEIIEICKLLEDIGKKQKDKNPLLSFYYQDSTKILGYVKDFYSNNVTAQDILHETRFIFNSIALPESFDPLSSLLSIPNTLQNTAQGLPKYIGAGDLVGASLLQFTETLLLTSYHIPIWAAKQNVWHQELRIGPAGYLKRLNNPVIATKIMMLGLYAGIRNVKERHPDDKHPTTSVLITAKRDKDKEEIKKSAILATEFISKNEKGIDDKGFEDFIPKVLGMDLAGIERGNLPDNVVEQFRESFRRCLLMTVHAGEDESVESVWQAVYSLHASRIGHGLKLDDYPDLKRLFKDRQICVELCPKSNQFTNGYTTYSQEKTSDEGYFVFEDYWKYGIPVTINTDDPLLSHRTNDTNMPYPLSEEYLILPHLLGTNPKSGNGKPFSVNRLLILKLIYNGFKYSFLCPKEKARLIEYADREVFNVLAEEFLDVYISAER
jgi:adenosine deaminase